MYYPMRSTLRHSQNGLIVSLLRASLGGVPSQGSTGSYTSFAYVKRKKEEEEEEDNFSPVHCTFAICRRCVNNCQFYNLHMSRTFIIKRTIVHRRESIHAYLLGEPQEFSQYRISQM